jgi:LPXTG-motif cell wall-anchored protein
MRCPLLSRHRVARVVVAVVVGLAAGAGNSLAGTNLPPGDYPVWSPDGRVLFVSIAQGDLADAWIVDPKTQIGRKLVPHAGPGRFSPSGDRIALAGYDRLTIARANGEIVLRRQINRSAQAWVSTPAWAPDGRRLAVYTAASGAILVGRLDQRRWHRVTRKIEEYHNVSWSPDGRQIVYTRGIYAFADDSLNLGVVNANGSADRIIAQGDLPVWSPKGDVIAYAALVAHSDGVGGRGVYVVRSTGRGRRCLANPPGVELGLAWSSDGNHVVISTEDHGSVALYVATTNRQGFRPVRQGELARLAPLTGDAAFARDGRGFVHLSGENGTTQVEVIEDGPTLPPERYHRPRGGCPPASVVAAELPNTGSDAGWVAVAGALLAVFGLAARLLLAGR